MASEIKVIDNEYVLVNTRKYKEMTRPKKSDLLKKVEVIEKYFESENLVDSIKKAIEHQDFDIVKNEIDKLQKVKYDFQK